MVLTEIALFKWQTNVSLDSEDCLFAVHFLLAFEANQGVTLKNDQFYLLVWLLVSLLCFHIQKHLVAVSL